MNPSRALRRNRRGQIAAGTALVVIGVVALALQQIEGPGRSVVLLLAGGSFIAAYFYSDFYGLLIPGGILSGLGLGMIAAWCGLPVRDPNSVGLGAGFVAIFLIERLYRSRGHWWPLIPGVILIVTGVGAGFEDIGHILWRWAPAALVVLGVVIVVRAIRRGSPSRNADSES